MFTAARRPMSMHDIYMSSTSDVCRAIISRSIAPLLLHKRARRLSGNNSLKLRNFRRSSSLFAAPVERTRGSRDVESSRFLLWSIPYTMSARKPTPLNAYYIAINLQDILYGAFTGFAGAMTSIHSICIDSQVSNSFCISSPYGPS